MCARVAAIFTYFIPYLRELFAPVFTPTPVLPPAARARRADRGSSRRCRCERSRCACPQSDSAEYP